MLPEEYEPPKPAKFYDLLPRDIIDHWLDGRYSLGPHRTITYDALGWALMLRGFYRYEAFDEKNNLTHWGYEFIDLEGGEIYSGGVRLWSANAIAAPNHPYIWRSEMCKIDLTREHPRFLCAYRLVYLDKDKPPVTDSEKKLEEIHKGFSECFPTAGASMPGKNDLQDEPLRSCSLNYLAHNFDADWRAIKEASEHFYGVYELELKRGATKFEGPYRGAGSGGFMVGRATNIRIFNRG